MRSPIQQPPEAAPPRRERATWIVAAARKVMVEYGGDAAPIWAGRPTAAESQRRLDAFAGIGQKKAARAAEMLERDLGVAVADMTGSDSAYDVHVRRLFLRTGLAERDDPDHMIEAARRAYPQRPGTIGAPAWVVGRRWCTAGVPDCPWMPAGPGVPEARRARRWRQRCLSRATCSSSSRAARWWPPSCHQAEGMVSRRRLIARRLRIVLP